MDNKPLRKVLIIEDDPSISEIVNHVCQGLSLNTQQCFTGTEALITLQNQTFDLIITDLMLPGICGEELLKILKATSSQSAQTPIIVMSAKTSVEDKVHLLTLGAEDYITKPFDIEELKARIIVQLRKNAPSQILGGAIKFKKLSFDPEGMSVHVNGQLLSLTVKEVRLLELLLKNPNKLFTKENLYTTLWEDQYIGTDNTINVHMSNLRQKIAEHDKDQVYIETVWGMGYKLKSDSTLDFL